jgi:hypothetical protein
LADELEEAIKESAISLEPELDAVKVEALRLVANAAP